MRLTDLQIKTLKPPQKGQKTYFDDLMKGFGVRVSMGGSKSFVLMYGKRRKLKTIGRYPDMALADARKKAKQVQGEVTGHDDGLAGTSASLTFSETRERFLEDARARNKASTHAEYRRLLTKHFTFANPMSAITRQNCMEVISGLKETPGEARHAYLAIRSMMNWAVVRGLIQISPVPAMRFESVSRTRILTDDEFKIVWKRAEGVGYPYGTIIKFLILTGQRRGEIAGLRRSWITDDVITFPVGFAKNKREHRIPIGPLTIEIIAGVQGDTDLLFPARGRDNVPFSGWSKAKAEFDKPLNLAPYTLHDLRRTYSSNLAKLGVQIHVTEKLLNHVSGTISGVAAIYNRHSYWDEMKAAMTTHESYVAKLTALAKVKVA